MPQFALQPQDGGQLIPLPTGETLLGRGALLGVSDKRVSRQHGLLENVGGQLRIKPTHVNPCFHQCSPDDPSQPLEKDQWHQLHPGELFSLLPGKYVYMVVSPGKDDNTQRNSQTFAEQSPVVPSRADEEPGMLNDQSCSITCVTHKPWAQSPNSRGEIPPPTRTPDDKMPVLGVYSPSAQDLLGQTLDAGNETHHVERKRLLPAWMLQSSADQKSPGMSKGGGRRGRARKTDVSSGAESEQSAEERVQHTPAKAPKCCTKRTRDGIVKSDEESRRSQSEPVAERLTKRQRVEERQDTPQSKTVKRPQAREDKKQTNVSPTVGSEINSKVRQPCPYGPHCYRKNPAHFQECSHPGDGDYREAKPHDDDDDDRPECPYGTGCYRKNPQHKKEFKHTKVPEVPPDVELEDEDSEDEDSDYEPTDSDASEGKRQTKNFPQRRK